MALYQPCEKNSIDIKLQPCEKTIWISVPSIKSSGLEIPRKSKFCRDPPTSSAEISNVSASSGQTIAGRKKQ